MHGLLGNCCDIKNIKYDGAPAHQSFNGAGNYYGIKPIINEKKIGYDWGAFTGITLNKDEDSSRIIEELKRYLK
jgi:Lrp/AsnC family transcriptional regulator for asnA, asnC and gidA